MLSFTITIFIFFSVITEIEERIQFLNEMEKLGAKHKYDFDIKNEISQKLKRLQDLSDDVNNYSDLWHLPKYNFVAIFHDQNKFFNCKILKNANFSSENFKLRTKKISEKLWKKLTRIFRVKFLLKSLRGYSIFARLLHKIKIFFEWNFKI